MRNLFHTYTGLHAACGYPIVAAAVHWTLPCHCSHTPVNQTAECAFYEHASRFVDNQIEGRYVFFVC